MKRSLILIGLLFSAMMQAQEVIPLWPAGCPDDNGIREPEVVQNDRISNVSNPWITVYLPETKNTSGTAVLICPGGGYIRQAAGHEGKQIAQWFASCGITAFVLKYRFPNQHPQIPLEDAQQAVRILRSRAAEWKINPHKIGVCGFSAGGHLAATLATHFDDQPAASGLPGNKNSDAGNISCRPDFALLFYPVISMEKSLTHAGSRDNLLGSQATSELVDYYSNEKQVRSNTPPALLLLSDDDKTVVPDNSIAFYQALKEKNIAAALYIFPEGGHGWGFNSSFRYHEDWKKLLLEWLRQQKFNE